MQDAAGSVKSFSISRISTKARIADSSDTVTSSDTWLHTIPNCVASVLRAPSVSAIDVIAGNSMILPARRLWNMQSAPSVSTPITRVAGDKYFVAEMIPEINPPPPMEATMRSGAGICCNSSGTMVPWPAMTA